MLIQSKRFQTTQKFKGLNYLRLVQHCIDVKMEKLYRTSRNELNSVQSTILVQHFAVIWEDLGTGIQ